MLLRFHKGSPYEWIASGYFALHSSSGDLSSCQGNDFVAQSQISIVDELTLMHNKLAPEGMLHGGTNVRSIFQFRADSPIEKNQVELQVKDSQGQFWTKIEWESAEGYARTARWEIGRLIEWQSAQRQPPTMPTCDSEITAGINPSWDGSYLQAHSSIGRSICTKGAIMQFHIEKNKVASTGSDMI